MYIPLRHLLPFRRPPSELAMRERITAAGGSLRPRRPGALPLSWRNTALRTQAVAVSSVAEARRLGLVPHQDQPKNWDLLVAAQAIVERTPRSQAVLEMGAARYSPLLQWLYLWGYRRLRGIDLIYDRLISQGPIRFEGMDLTKTTYADGSFGAIACLSVIEHGVDLDAYLRETRRLLRPGGVLVTSTDYWPEPIDTSGATAYGQPVRIFDRAAMEAFLAAAVKAGYRLTGPANLDADERVVHWERTALDYTFLVFVMEAVPQGGAERVRAGASRLAARLDGLLP